MKLRSLRHHAARAQAPEAKPVAPVPRPVSAGAPPRVWSLLLPPGFTNDRK